jgi:hypothetical protein
MIHLALLVAATLFLGYVALALIGGAISVGESNRGCGCGCGVIVAFIFLAAIAYFL